MLESGLPDVLELFVRVEDYLIQRRGFRFTLFIVLELFLLALSCVSPEHRRQNREIAVGSFLGESESNSEEARRCHPHPSTQQSRSNFASGGPLFVGMTNSRDAGSHPVPIYI